MNKILKPNFRYTFPKQTVVNIFGEQIGNYKVEYKKKSIVINVDKFGEVRVSNETPVNNETRFSRYLIKLIGG